MFASEGAKDDADDGIDKGKDKSDESKSFPRLFSFFDRGGLLRRRRFGDRLRKVFVSLLSAEGAIF